MREHPKDKIYNFRTYTSKINEASAVLKNRNTDLPTVFNQVLDQIILTNDVPLKTKEDLEADAFLNDLSRELTATFERMEHGESFTQEEAEKRLGI